MSRKKHRVLTEEQRELVANNKELAYFMFHKWRKKRPDIPEYILEGICIEGLCNCATTFNPDLGYKFSTYACNTMKFNILNYLERKHNKIKNEIFMTDLYDENKDGRDYLPCSIQESLSIKSSCSIEKLRMKEILKNLDERSKEILYLYYVEDKTQTEISEKFNLSQVQISRILSKIRDIVRKEYKEVG